MSRLAWVRFVATRWFRSGRHVGPSLAPATAGIAVGVAALLCVIGVMNGFQVGFIDAVLDLDSYHVRIPATGTSIGAVLSAVPGAQAALQFVDVHTVVANTRGKASPLRIKIVPDSVMAADPAFAGRLTMRAGAFGTGLAVGSELARSLDIRVGDTVSVLSVRSSVDTGIEARMLEFTVGGIYHCGYFDFDAGLAFLPASLSEGLDAGEAAVIGLRLADRYDDERALASLKAAGIAGAESWRTYNRAFFGALRMEKTVMLMLVGLIFIVVGVNIFHLMRKAVYGRVEDIATIKALGAASLDVRRIFMLDGIAAGAGGALAGLVAGLLVAFNINGIFGAISAITSAINGLTGGNGKGFEFFSPDLFYIGDVPVRLSFIEVLFIAGAGAASALVAAWAASARVSNILPAEVLRDE